jgi:hypothetical protein
MQPPGMGPVGRAGHAPTLGQITDTDGPDNIRAVVAFIDHVRDIRPLCGLNKPNDDSLSVASLRLEGNHGRRARAGGIAWHV